MRRREVQLFAVVGVVRGGFVIELGGGGVVRLARGFGGARDGGANTNSNSNANANEERGKRYEKLTDVHGLRFLVCDVCLDTLEKFEIREL